MFYSTKNRNARVTVFIEDAEVELPTRWAICSTCSGNGTNSLHLGAFSGRRLEEAREDEEFWDDYMSGRMDQKCDSCDGTGKVREVDLSALTPEQKAAYDEDREFEAEQEAELRAEYRMSDEYRAEMRGDY